MTIPDSLRIAARMSHGEAENAKSSDRLGGMLEHLYPKDKDWAGPEGRRRWWALVTEPESIAKSLRR